MKFQCQNHRFRVKTEMKDVDLTTVTVEEITERIDCNEVATTVVVDDYDGQTKDVCDNCYNEISLSNWLATEEGRAALAESWNDDEN